MNNIKHFLEGGAGMAVFLSLLNVLPPILTIISLTLAIVWYIVQITSHFKDRKEE